MRALSAAVILICCVGLWVTAYRLPWNGNRDFAWEISPRIAVSVGIYGVAWYVDGQGGCQYTDLYVWPPRIRRHFISEEAGQLLFDDRIWSDNPKFDPLWRFQYEVFRERDRRREWTWPHWARQ